MKETENFDIKKAEKHLTYLLSWYKIKVRKWRVTSSGCAFWKSKEIEIPKPTDPDRFGVCMHEIKHIIDGDKGTRFEQEFRCDKYAMEQMLLLGFGGIQEWVDRMKWHCLSRIAMAHNRGLNPNKINKEIREFFADVDFSKWVNMKVFIDYHKNEPYLIKLTPNLTKVEIVEKLSLQGLLLEKSDSDDSTYGRWIVKKKSDTYGYEFTNLSDIIKHYELA